jgi:hypothetical protein
LIAQELPRRPDILKFAGKGEIMELPFTFPMPPEIESKDRQTLEGQATGEGKEKSLGFNAGAGETVAEKHGGKRARALGQVQERRQASQSPAFDPMERLRHSGTSNKTYSPQRRRVAEVFIFQKTNRFLCVFATLR